MEARFSAVLAPVRQRASMLLSAGLHLCVGLGLAAAFNGTPPAEPSAPAPAVVVTVSSIEGALRFHAAAQMMEIASPTPNLEASLPAQSLLWDPAPATPVANRADLGACDVGGRLQAALREDVAVMDALNRLPADARSVANAVSIWNGAWVESAEASNILRTRIESLLHELEPGCLEADVAGPRFIVLDIPAGAVVLALGSGQWRWRALLDRDS
jgi:hypothetical protein